MNESTRKPYITVFTPTYNRAYTLQRLYESLRKQTQYDFEWLIVDDGSTDNTESLVQEFIRENSLFNIRYTPSSFARTSLLHLQEVGSLQATHSHTSIRTDLVSFLCFVVLSGKGSLKYEGVDYELEAGDCVHRLPESVQP